MDSRGPAKASLPLSWHWQTRVQVDVVVLQHAHAVRRIPNLHAQHTGVPVDLDHTEVGDVPRTRIRPAACDASK